MLLHVDIEERDTHAVVFARGDIDAATAHTVGTAVEQALTDGWKTVLLDFSEVTFIDSTGLGMLVKSHGSAEAAQARFAVVHPTAPTRKLIQVVGLDGMLLVFDDHAQALEDDASDDGGTDPT